MTKNYEALGLPASERKMLGLNHKMGKMIKSRDTNQCRSHHQKMLLKHDTIKGVIEAHLNLLSPRNQKIADRLLGLSRQVEVKIEEPFDMEYNFEPELKMEVSNEKTNTPIQV